MQSAFDKYERRMWAGRADAYGRTFARLCAHLVPALLDAAGVAAGLDVLDVGTGTGSAAAAASARGARVTAIDADAHMVEAARRNVPGAEVRRATLPRLPFGDGTFDAVTGNFVVNHVGDPGTALAEMRRVLRPGGRLAATIWRHPGEAGQALLWRAVDAAGVEKPELPRVEADFPRTEEGFAALLSGAGLRTVDCVSVVWDHREDPERWWSGAAEGIATIGLVLGRLSPDVRAVVRTHYERLAAAFVHPDGTLALPHAALLAHGTR
ncbi:methyltransferase domain-containing protein [Streptomyces sp. NPDC051776]|uniref:class I SAM-dependent methyltransferase n=1 Tax=Streptomyces sp. NPDC051776 TaxID=3155414 RepID=UPI00342B5042